MTAQEPSAAALRRELQAYYDPLLPLWDRTLAGRGDLELWRWAADRRAGEAMLEVGAGSGRVSEVLAPAADPLVALDLNPEALRRARGRLAGEEGVHLVQADMRSFRLACRFAVAVAANDPFSHLRGEEGRSRALERIAEHLEAGGRFFLDALWLSESWVAEAAGGDGREVSYRASADADAPLDVRQRWRCDPDARTCTATFRYLREGDEVARTTFRGRYWTLEEVERRFPAAGLRVEALWGSYDREPWTPESERMVVVAAPR